MIHITIENETVNGIQHDLKKLLEGAKDLVEAKVEVKPMPESRPLRDAQNEPDKEPEIGAQPTMEQTRAKLNDLRGSKGPKAVRTILTSHGVGSFTELDPTEYAAVIAEVDAAL